MIESRQAGNVVSYCGSYTTLPEMNAEKMKIGIVGWGLSDETEQWKMSCESFAEMNTP